MLFPVLVLLAGAAAPSAQVQARIQEGLAALERNDLAKAQVSFEQATRLGPKDAAAWLLLAQIYAKLKNPKAREAAQKAETFAATDTAVLQGLANFYATLVPDLAKAMQFGARYAEANPQDTTAWRRLAAFCIEAGDPQQAIAAGKRAVAANPYDEDSHFQLAQAYLLRQDFSSAISTLQNARKTFDKSPQIELALGVAYYGQRKFPEAVNQFLTTMRLAPDVPQPYLFLGRMMDHLGDRLPEAAERFAQFEERNPNSYLGYLLHAEALLAQASPDADAALPLLRKSLQLRDEDSEAHYLLGTLLEQQREFEPAARELERSIQLNAKDPAAHFRLARVYDRLGRKQDAAEQRALHEKLSEQEKAK